MIDTLTIGFLILFLPAWCLIFIAIFGNIEW